MRQGKPGGFFSAWFGDTKRALGFGRHPDFHRFRHTVRTQLAESEVEEQMIDRLMGHEVKGSEGAKRYTHLKAAILKRAADRVSYPGLELPKVFTS